MIALLRAEFLKLRSTRTSIGLGIAVLLKLLGMSCVIALKCFWYIASHVCMRSSCFMNGAISRSVS